MDTYELTRLAGGSLAVATALVALRAALRRGARARSLRHVVDGLQGQWTGLWFIGIPAHRSREAREGSREEAFSPLPSPRAITDLWKRKGAAVLSHLPAPGAVVGQRVERSIEEHCRMLSRTALPAALAGAAHDVFAIVYVSTAPPPRGRNIDEVRSYIEGCGAVGFVSCPVARTGMGPRVGRALGTAVLAALAVGVVALSLLTAPRLLTYHQPTTRTSGDRLDAPPPAVSASASPSSQLESLGIGGAEPSQEFDFDSPESGATP